MVILEHEQIEIDYCPECRGIWLDSGELELLFDDPSQAKQLLASFAGNPQSVLRSRKCPICGKRMTEVRVGTSEPPILIDECPQFDGLWFDKDELEQAFAVAGHERVQKIQKWLAGAFGRI